jgi:alpha-N-arabinofuranosidase
MKAIAISLQVPATELFCPWLLDAQSELPSFSISTRPRRVSPKFYGLMTEEINFSYDGGLCAELLRNRSFKDDPKDPVHWQLVQPAGASGSIALDPSHHGSGDKGK